MVGRRPQHATSKLDYLAQSCVDLMLLLLTAEAVWIKGYTYPVHLFSAFIEANSMSANSMRLNH